MRLRIVSTLTFIAGVATFEIVDAHHFDLRGVAWVRAGSTLADTTPLKATIEELLLAFKWVLKFAELKLLLLH